MFEAQMYQGNALMADFTPAAAVAAGEVIVAGGEAHIAHSDLEANVQGSIAIPSSSAIYKVAKGAGVLTAGTKVDWDGTGKTVVATTTGDAPLGVVATDAADADTHVLVRHDPA